MQASIRVSREPAVQYLLRLGDTCLIQAQRLAEWCGHAPVLEEDIALTNMALDLVGQARAVLTLAGRLGGRDGAVHDEDQLAFLRDERDFLNLTLVELPRGDFAVTVLRNFMLATFLKLLWQRLLDSSDAELAAIAAQGGQGSALPPAARRRLGAAAGRRHRRIAAPAAGRARAAVALHGRDVRGRRGRRGGRGQRPRPALAALREAWLSTRSRRSLQEAGVALPAERAFRSTGKRGVHSEHMGYILAEMQHLQRAFPGGVW